jgi:hypothetical protein
VAAAEAKRRRKDDATFAKKAAPADPADDAHRRAAAGRAARKVAAEAAAVGDQTNWSKYRSAAPGLEFTVDCECVAATHGGCTVKFMRPLAAAGRRALASSAKDAKRAIGAAAREAANGGKASAVVTRVPVERGSGLARRIHVRFYGAVAEPDDEPDITSCTSR